MQLLATLVWIPLAAALAAQGRTFVIDRSNGPGTNFTDLPPALAQAQDGDVFHVRAGSYSRAATDKGVALLGGPGVVVDGDLGGFEPVLQVANLARGATFVARGLALHANNTVAALRLSNNAGRVHLSNLQPSLVYWTPAVEINTCTAVTMTDVDVNGWISARSATLALERVRAIGRSSSSWIYGAPGLAVHNGAASIVDGTFTGSGWVRTMAGVVPPQPGVVAVFSEVTVSATAPGRTRLQAGAGVSFPGWGAPALWVSGSVIVDPRVSLVPSTGEPPAVVEGWGTITPFPALETRGGAIGGAVTANLVHLPGQPYALALAHVRDPVRLHFGQLFLEPMAHVVLAAGMLDPAGRAGVTVPVPNDPFLAGKVYVLQALSLEQGGALFLANASFVTLQ